jgi:hypothetical protein
MLLIKAVNAIQQKNLDNDALRYVLFLVHAFHHFEMLVPGINEAAVAGRRAENGRVKGPQARAAEGIRKQEIIWELAEAYWKRVPVDRNNFARTVDRISNDLRLRLEAEGFKPIGTHQVLSYLRKARDSAGYRS